MNPADLEKEIHASFPNAEKGRIFLVKQNILLEELYGFTPDNTRFAEGGCCDEINEPEYRLMDRYWGERFKFGGLAGYCHGGRSGLAAVSHHVPEAGGRKNLILLAGPHIGYHRGVWGQVLRRGQSAATACCGSLVGVLKTGYAVLSQKTADPMDQQQHTVERLLLPHLKTCWEGGETPEILQATRYLMQRIEGDLLAMVQDLETHFDGQIAVMTGITINTEQGNYFSPSYFRVHGQSR